MTGWAGYDGPDQLGKPAMTIGCADTASATWLGSDEYLILMGILFALGLIWWAVRSLYRRRHHSSVTAPIRQA